MTIDRGMLDALVTGYAAAIGAVERYGERILGIKRERACAAAILESGSAPAGCSAAQGS